MSADDDAGRDRCPTYLDLVAPRVSDRVPEPEASTGVRLGAEVDTETFKSWSAEAQERALTIIQQRKLNPWRPFYCPRLDCDGQPHDVWTWQHARADQRPPPMSDDWLVWLLMSGRGSGKTRTGSETIHRMVRKVPRIHLVAPTGPDLRDTMVEGVSGLQATAPPDFVPEWEPSKKRLTWPNGAVALGFSGEEPDRLRGPQCYWAWIDEPAHMPNIQDVWDNLLFGLRLGQRPRIVATTTPKPTKWMKALAKDDYTRVSSVSTYANLHNLAETYQRNVLKRFEGTRLGLQELEGKILEDVEGALWQANWIEYVELKDVPLSLDRVVVAIDPAGTKNKRSDATGIVVLGIAGEDIYVLLDATDRYSPSGWATKAVQLYHKYSADALVAEKNYGGDMVREVLEKNGAEKISIEEVTSRRGKAIRAEPIATLYERENTHVYHVRDVLEELETELTTWVPGEGDSPNRLDALVHGITALASLSMPASIASPASYSHERTDNAALEALKRRHGILVPRGRTGTLGGTIPSGFGL